MQHVNEFINNMESMAGFLRRAMNQSIQGLIQSIILQKEWLQERSDSISFVLKQRST